jgi:ferrochelatase
MNYQAVLFISFGGPEKPDDILPFLETVTRGRGIPADRLKEVAHHYEVIGGASPINKITRRQADALQKTLPLPVYVGNRNWHPFIEATLRQMTKAGVKQAIGFVTAAYRCEASWERYVKAVEAARERIGASAPVIDYVDPWFDHPAFINAITARVAEISQHPSSAVFTAHSIPLPMAEASRYVQELEATAGLVCDKLGIKKFQLAYTSRSGKPTDPWLEPDINDVIQSQGAQGMKEMLVIPIGFLADHVEVLYDLDIEARETAQKADVRLSRAKTVGDHPQFVQMMSDVIRKKL